MRRNFTRFLKYAIVAVLFFMLGPPALRFMFGSSDDGSIGVHQRGLPMAPGEMDSQKKSLLVSHSFLAAMHSLSFS